MSESFANHSSQYLKSLQKFHRQSDLLIQYTIMLKNSIEKYKQKYTSAPSSPNKNSRVIKVIATPTKNQSQSRIDFTTHSNVNYASTKKLQTYNVFNEKHNFIYNCGPPKDQDAKLRKTLTKCSTASKRPEQKPNRTPQNSRLQQSTFTVEMDRNSEDFIQTMPKNTLFYCTHCFQFIFDIEKKRHYPQCKDLILIKNRQTQEFYKMAHRKLTTIVELSKYTGKKAKEIEKLYEGVLRQNFEVIDKIRYPQNHQFFKLEQIEMAFAFTYNTLLKGVKYRAETSLFTCF